MAASSMLAGLRGRLERIGERRSVRIAAARARRSWRGFLVGLLVIVLGVLAFVNPGVKAADVQLDDGSVYVQNANLAMVGMLNYQIEEIAASTIVGVSEVSIYQEGSTVLVYNHEGSTLQVYDPATNTLSAPVKPPMGALFSLNNGILAVSNPENGKVWAGDVNEIAHSDFSGDATLDVGDFGHAIVSASGELIGLNVQESKIVHADGSEVEIPFSVDSQALTTELSAIGDRAVVLDKSSQQIWVEGDSQPTQISSGTSALLPTPVADNEVSDNRPVYATQAGLNTFDKGSPKSLSGLINQAPVRPVIVGDCLYGAFGNQFVKVCNGQDPEQVEIPELPEEATLTFQTNRGVVVLQDTISGRIWLVDKGMKIVDQWEREIPKTDTPIDDPQNTDERTKLPDRKEENTPPIANDDPNLAARAGRSSILPVLDNDSDDDGDVITITETSGLGRGATLEPVGHGAGLQITLPAEASGTFEFSYTIDDGRGGTASAKARVQALPAEQSASNRKPEMKENTEVLHLSSGSTGSKRALLSWRDPDGDDLVLVNAQVADENSEDEVSFTTEGLVTFRDVGKTTGIKKVRVTVSDGVQTSDGILNVDVSARDAAAPVANADFVSVIAGREVVVSPLDNDEGRHLILTEVSESTSDYTIEPNYAEGTFTFRSAYPGTYYLTYTVSNGPVSEGLVRVDVKPDVSANNIPVAVRDTVLVPFGGSALVDPLLNDIDEDGDVLVIQSVSTDPAIEVIMRERHLLTISMKRYVSEPIALTYWVSDGRNSVPGTIVVFPQAGNGEFAPRAENDEVRIRAGAVASVPVLRNDVSPVGLDLSLDSLPSNPLGEDQAWIDQDRVRIKIPEDTPATTMSLTYEISDSEGRTDSGQVAITVISADAQNEPPTPQTIEARVLSDSTTRIPIDFSGVDPNGDKVRILGLGSGPALGRIVDVGDDWFDYQAYADSRGTDQFRYELIDSFGAVASGELRVGVAPPSEDGSGPVGVTDEVTVRPGRQVMIPALVNDYDVDGEVFGYRQKNPVEFDTPAEIVDNQFIKLKAPDEEGDYVGQYYTKDRRGVQGNGTFLVHVHRDAPPIPPVAADDAVPVSDILQEDWVDVDVLANDYDADGDRSELRIDVVDTQANGVEAQVKDGRLTIKVADQMQQVRYTITDSDGLSDQGVVLVPGRDDSAPVLSEPGKEHSVEAGQTFTINLDSMVTGTQGRRVQLTTSDAVRATNGTVNIRSDGIDFVSDINYVGPASVVFEVIDRSDADDNTAKRAFLSVSIDVTPAKDHARELDGPQANRPPQGPSEVQLQVGAGEEDQEFGLRDRFTDPEGDNFNFQSWQQTSGGSEVTWTASVGGEVITARAEPTARGSSITLDGKIVDAYGASRSVRVIIDVIASTRPLPVAQTDTVDDANAGQPSFVQVLANDKSFLFNNDELNVVGARVVSGAGEAKVDDDAVIVEPHEDFVGHMTVAYTIVDATMDPDRQVDGVIELTVRGRPSRPGVPTIENELDKAITIKWTSNSDNGMPVIARTVVAKSDAGTVTYHDCQTNTCTIPGLKNAVGYTFTVSEANEIGASDPSGSSAVGIPDIVPPPPARPRVSVPEQTPGTLDIEWDAPQFDGSPVETYYITQSAGPDASAGKEYVVEASATRKRITGLKDFTNYRFQVVAENRKGRSAPSEPSDNAMPLGPPKPVKSVDAQDTDDINGSELEVTWQPGELVPGDMEYHIYLKGSQKIDATAPKDATSTRIKGLEPNKNYQVCVYAQNRGGKSAEVCSDSVSTIRAPRDTAKGEILEQSKANSLSFVLGQPGDWTYATVALKQLNNEGVGAKQKVQPGQTVTFDGLHEGWEYVVYTIAFNETSQKTKAAQEKQATDKFKVYGVPTYGKAGFDHYETGNKVQFIAEAGRDQVAYARAGGGEFKRQDKATFTLNIYSKDTPVEIKVCWRDRPRVCDTKQLRSVDPALLAERSGDTLKLKVSNQAEKKWQCSIGSRTIDDVPGDVSWHDYDIPSEYFEESSGRVECKAGEFTHDATIS